MLSRRTFLGTAAGVCSAQSRARRPNFLFLIADDHAGYVMGCDGNGIAKTPNLDKLAAEGTRFSRHFCNSPVCTPSRQSFFTGQMPHMAGVTRLATPLAEDKPTLARQFHAAGYKTAVFGKMHFNREGRAGLHGFDYLMTERELAREWNAKITPRAVPESINTKPVWRPFKDPARIWLNADKLPYPRFEEEMRSSYLVRQAVGFLEENRDQPFALWVSFQEPHSPFDFPVEDRTWMEPDRLTVPRVGGEDGPQIPLIFRELTADDKRGIAAAYYTSVRFLDRNIGHVLNTLANLKLDEQTFVVYVADHGYTLGHHGRFEKHCGYDEALRVPLLMRWPGHVRQGVVTDMTEHVDVTATITDLMGLDPLPIQHGRSLRAYVEGRRPDRREHIFSEYLENEEAFLRTGKWKYIFCSGKRRRTDGYETADPTPGRYHRLFDLQADPGEFRDVASAHPEAVQELQRLMLERFRTTHPDREAEPQRLAREEAIEWYLRPRDQ
jgi:choline-sulfatase